MSDRMAMMWGLALAAVSRENETVHELMSGIYLDTDAVERIADRYAAARAMGAEADQWEAVAREAITALGVQPSGTMAPREARALILAGIAEVRGERDRLREEVAALRAVPEVRVQEARKPRGHWRKAPNGSMQLFPADSPPPGPVDGSRECLADATPRGWMVLAPGEGALVSRGSDSLEEAMLAAEDWLDAHGIAFELVEVPVERKLRGKWDGSALRHEGEVVAYAHLGGGWEIYRITDLNPFRTGITNTHHDAKLAAEERLDAAGIPYDLAGGAA